MPEAAHTSCPDRDVGRSGLLHRQRWLIFIESLCKCAGYSKLSTAATQLATLEPRIRWTLRVGLFLGPLFPGDMPPATAFAWAFDTVRAARDCGFDDVFVR
jgi:hypothetical protein